MDTQDYIVGLSPYARMVRLAESVKPGMSRSQVEKMFPHSHGGIQGQAITIYQEMPRIRIEIPFNNNGGCCSMENQVIGMARVFMTFNAF